MRRRDFIKASAALGFVSLTSQCGQEPLWKPEAYRKTKGSKVAILKADGYQEDLVKVIIDGIKACNLLVMGKRIFLKPNLVEYEKNGVINTNPAIIGAAIEAFYKLGAVSVIVGEGAGHRRDIDGILIDSGLHSILKTTKTNFIDLNSDDTRRVPLKSDFMGVDSLFFPESIFAVDLLVSLPKLKTHHWAGMTISMKNMMGLIPGEKYGWPKNFLHWRGIPQSIVDINSTIRPHFAIVDGIEAMEGNGPIQGTSKHCGVLVFGEDLLAVDATCARIAGINPEKISYLKMAADFLGNISEQQIQQIGEPISRVKTSFSVLEGFKYLKT